MTIEPWMTLAGIFITGLLSYGAARYAGKATVRVKEIDVASQAYTQAEGITKGLIETLRKQIEDLQHDRAADLERIENIEREVREVRDHNNALVTFVYKMLAIFRKHGLTDQIDPKDVPDGIHI